MGVAKIACQPRSQRDHSKWWCNDGRVFQGWNQREMQKVMKITVGKMENKGSKNSFFDCMESCTL